MLMLRSDGESVDMNWNGNDDFVASIVRPVPTAHVVGGKTSFDTLPLGSAVLEPNFDLWDMF